MDAFLLPFIYAIFNKVASHKLYNFLDGLSDYNLNLIWMYPDNFCHQMGCFLCNRKLGYFSANNVKYVQRIIVKIFLDCIPAFMKVFLDHFVVCSDQRIDHLKHLHLYLEKCQQARLCRNPAKYTFSHQQLRILAISMGILNIAFTYSIRFSAPFIAMYWKRSFPKNIFLSLKLPGLIIYSFKQKILESYRDYVPDR